MIPAASVLDRNQALVVLIDVQERLAGAMTHRDRVVARAALVLRVAAIAGLPVVVTRQYPQGLGDLDEVLFDVLDHLAVSGTVVTRVDKVDFDCFAEPAFADAVGRSGRRQLLIMGMESHICVTQTALSGLREGFDVHVAADACCSRDEEVHRLALARLRTAGAVITTAESAVYEAIGRAGTDEFRALLTAVKAVS